MAAAAAWRSIPLINYWMGARLRERLINKKTIYIASSYHNLLNKYMHYRYANKNMRSTKFHASAGAEVCFDKHTFLLRRRRSYCCGGGGGNCFQHNDISDSLFSSSIEYICILSSTSNEINLVYFKYLLNKKKRWASICWFQQTIG